VALGTEEADRLLGGVPAGERMSSWHLVDSAGELTPPAPASLRLLRALPGGTPLAAIAPDPTDDRARLPLCRRQPQPVGHFVTDGAKAAADLKVAARS